MRTFAIATLIALSSTAYAETPATVIQPPAQAPAVTAPVAADITAPKPASPPLPKVPDPQPTDIVTCQRGTLTAAWQALDRPAEHREGIASLTVAVAQCANAAAMPAVPPPK